MTTGRDGAGAIHPGLVRSYDLRGVVGRELTETTAERVGRAYAAALRARGGRRVAVGYDGRLSSPALEAALVGGLVAGGAAVERIGRGPAGMLYFAVHDRALDGGIMVTGSHNPPDQNGFKLLMGTEPVYGSALRALVATEPADRAGGRGETTPIEAEYVERLLRAAASAPVLRVGWDPGHGATGDVLARLLERLPGEHHVINGNVDGHFPGHHPDPSVPENLHDLQRLVRERKLDLGIAFDGDGDRIGLVDGTGEIVWPDQLILFLAADLLLRKPGAPIVADVKSSRVLFDGVAAAGGRAVLSPSGYVLVREAMLRERAPMGGEMSGHIFFADDWYGTDDAIHVAIRVLTTIGRRGSLADFRRSLPRTYATPELRLPCPDEAKARVLAGIERAVGADGAAMDRTDGLRVTTEQGWWLVRASGTEPKLTARVEAWSEDGLKRLGDELARLFAEAGLPINAGLT